MPRRGVWNDGQASERSRHEILLNAPATAKSYNALPRDKSVLASSKDGWQGSSIDRYR